MAGEALHGEGGGAVLSVSVPGILSSRPERCREGQEKEGAGGGDGRGQGRKEEGKREEKEREGGKREEERRGGGRREKGSREAEEGSPGRELGLLSVNALQSPARVSRLL